MDAAFFSWMLCLQAQQIRQLEAQFYTDSLTKVGNRAAFDRALDRAWSGYCQGGQDFALLYLDGNNIKAVNDAYGHAVGDRVIAEIAASIRDQGLAFRLGGDEFALLLVRDAPISEKLLQRLSQQIQHRIWQAGRRLQSQLSIQSMLQGGRQFPMVSAAIGWSFASRAESAVDLQMKADAAMYVNKWRNKRLGRYLDAARSKVAHRHGSRSMPQPSTVDPAADHAYGAGVKAESREPSKAFRHTGKVAANVEGSTPKIVFR